MKILVTGADGFLGSNTVRYFKDRGYNVTAYTQDVKHSMPYETYDVLYHFAAFVGGRKGIDNNTWLVAKNIEIDRTVFEWAETYCGKIVYPSSCAAYPLWTQTSTDITMKENLPLDSVYTDVTGLQCLIELEEFIKGEKLVEYKQWILEQIELVENRDRFYLNDLFYEFHPVASAQETWAHYVGKQL